jgi:acetyl esterase/lipase
MRPMPLSICICFCACIVTLCLPIQAAVDTNAVEFSHQRNVIYGHKHGMALTMDVFSSSKANGIGVLWVVSGSGRSSIERIDKPSFQKCFQILLHKGYTVFAVVHSSAPRFTLQDMVTDIRRAVRYTRYHAQDFGINGEHIGIAGASAGGTLALLMGTTGQDGDPNHTDPVERVSSRVQAVGCFFGPSDWLNFDGQGTDVRTFQKQKYGSIDPSFLFYDPNKQTHQILTDEQKINTLLKAYSPVAHVTPDDAPTLIIHGEADPFIPFQQSQRMIKTFREKKVPCQLVSRPDKGHGWDGWEDDTLLLADWFDKYL